MIWSQFRRPAFWWLAGLVVIAAFVRFRGIRFGLPHTQARPDETAVIDPVRVLLSGHLPHFYDYPWLFLWMVAIAYLGYFLWGAATGTFQSVSAMLASWPVHWEPFFLIPRVISAIAGTLSVLLVFRLGRQLRDDTTAIVSALFFTFASMHVRGSHFGTTDVVMTSLIVAAVCLLIDAHRTRRRGQFVAAGVVAGLAAATKYNAVLLGVPMLVSHVLNVWDSPPSHRREAWLDPRIIYFSIPFAAAFAVGVPFVVLDRAPFLDAMRELAHALNVGDVHTDLGNGWLYQLTFSLRYGMGVPLLVAGLAGSVLLIWREPRTGLLLLSFPLAYYGVAGGIRLLFVRYAMPIVPFLCVTAAYLVCCSAAWMASRVSRFNQFKQVSAVVAAVLAAAIVWPAAADVWRFDRIINATDNRVVVAQWFFDHVPPGDTLLQTGSRYGLVQFWNRRFPYKEWRWDGARQVFILDGSRRFSKADRPDWIIVQDSPLPSSTQSIVKEMLADGYVTVAEF